MRKIQILYEDNNLLIVNKRAKQLTVATSKEHTNTLYHEVSDYVKKKYPKNKIFIVNRLDKDTSGIVVFAKNEKLKKVLQDNWQEYALQREYTAVVLGKVKEDGKTIKVKLKENPDYRVVISDDGKLAITEYEVLKKNKNYSLLKIIIKTGRKHQIRVSLSAIGHPIVGDKKYGISKNPLNRLALHANKLILQVPYLDKPITVEADVPQEFFSLVGDNDGKNSKSNI